MLFAARAQARDDAAPAVHGGDRDSAQPPEETELKLFFKIFAALLLLAVVLIATLAGAGLLMPVRPSQPADIAIVPGNSVEEDGTPSPRLAARLDRAVQCHQQKQCKLIFVSGGVEPSGTNEATAMRTYLTEHGVPATQIVVDSAGKDTWATAHNASAYMQAHHLTSALIVTQYFHVPRTMLALQRFGVSHLSGAYPWFWEPRDLYSMARELPAFVWYGFRPL